MTMAMTEVDEKVLVSSLLSSGLYSQMPEGGEIRTRRRRKKVKGDGTGEDAKKRRLSDEQVKFLEMNFGREHKLESGRKLHLASEIGLDPKQVAVWFQNRRARWKNKQLEEEYVKLKSLHESVVVEKCHLENEVLKLKEQLTEAEKEIRKYSGGTNGASSVGERGSSPSSSFSTETHQPPLLGEFGVEGNQDLMYMHEYNYINMMEWVNLYGM